MNTNRQLSKNFRLSEFVCKCGCGLSNVNPDLVTALQKLRDIIGKPVIVNSGLRCIAHNEAVGGSISSQHIDGNAADIRVVGIKPLGLSMEADEIDMFTFIKVYKAHVHVDVREI